METKKSFVGFKRLTHVLRVFSQILFWICAAAAVLIGIAAIILLFIPNDKFISVFGNTGSLVLTLDGIIKYDFKYSAGSSILVKPMFNSILGMAAVSAALMVPIFNQLYKILKTVEEDKPFSIKNASRLSNIGIVLISGSFLFKIVQYFAASVVMDIINTAVVNVNYSVDITMLLIGLMLLVLAGVFKYGCHLQQEYDATV